MKKNKCNVVMLATEKVPTKNQLRFDYDGLGLEFNDISRIQGASTQHLYITSSDEIKEGDWYVYKDKSIHQYKKEFNQSAASVSYNKKIIASTDSELHKDGVAKIGLPFIEDYIVKYNKGDIIKKVNVEY